MYVFVLTHPQTTAVFSIHVVHQLRSPVNKPDPLIDREPPRKSIYIFSFTDSHYNIKAESY